MPEGLQNPEIEAAAARAGALLIVRELRNNGHIAYFAGGCVRDELLGLHPSDYDVATDANPARIAELFRNTNHVGAAFGVVLVKLKGVVVEVATFRADAAYSDRRRPDSVRFADAKVDAARRDFTINALFLDPLARAADDGLALAADGPANAPALAPTTSPLGGLVIDHVGGVEDLRRRVLRAVGDPEQRLAEDNLRALRAARLAARLDFLVEEGTANAIRRHARELAGVSRERVGEELRRMLEHPRRSESVRLLMNLELDGPVLEEECLGSEASLATLRALPEHTRFAVALAAWAMDRGLRPEIDPAAPLLTRWRSAMCLSNEERAELAAILELVALLRSTWSGLRVAAQKRATQRAAFRPAVLLVEAWDPDLASRVTRRVEELAATPSGLGPDPYITGDDLIAGGLNPGPRFKQVLEEVYDAQLEGHLTTRAQALQIRVGGRKTRQQRRTGTGLRGDSGT